jgi:PAS domain S-box-containing protein
VGKVESLLQGIVDGITNAAVVLRVGIFARMHGERKFRIIAGRGCRDEASKMEVSVDDPFVRWLEINPQLVSRTTLCHINPVSDQLMLRRVLDTVGAELIVPLQGRSRLLGWLFLGRRATGLPFDHDDLQDVMVFADHVATALENALLYEEIARDKTLAETLLHSVSTGIVAADENGCVQWFNDAAEQILGLPRQTVMGCAVEVTGSRIAAHLRTALASAEPSPQTVEWTDMPSKRHLSLRTTRLMKGSQCLGAVAFINDLTRERQLNRRQKQLDRTAFWTELAANMSHEIRNPLVAIKTFAQLLPERYMDMEFRSEFSAIVAQEVDRLNTIIEQINKFAELPEPEFKTVDMRETLNKAMEMAKLRAMPSGINIRNLFTANIPDIHGDPRALAECFSHIITNAMEALAGKQNPTIEIAARPLAFPDHDCGVEVVVRDNAGGMPPQIKEKAFSPFCTTKSMGMGLGLPIAQRIVIDHSGNIQIESNDSGTAVLVALPAGANRNQESASEAPVGR